MAPVLNMEAGRISAQAALADGGNIVLEGDRFVLQDADVTAAVGGGLGDGGNVNILAFDYMVLNRSSIAASAIGGQGGNILITTNALIGDNQSTLDASSELGIDGTVVVNSPENEVERALLVPSGDYTDAEALLQARCSAATTAQSSLVVTSGDGLPPSPDAFLSFAGSTDTFTTASIKNPPFLAQLTCVP